MYMYMNSLQCYIIRISYTLVTIVNFFTVYNGLYCYRDILHIHIQYQLHTVAVLILSFRFLVPSFDLHGLKWLGEVVALSEVLCPLGDVGFQKSTLFAMLHHSLTRGDVSEDRRGERERERGRGRERERHVK